MTDDPFATRAAGGALPPPDALPAEADALARAVRPAEPRSSPRAEVDSFRRSDAYLAGQIARAVARGQRVL